MCIQPIREARRRQRSCQQEAAPWRPGGSVTPRLQRECLREATEKAARGAVGVSADTWHSTGIVKMDDGCDNSYLLVVLGLIAVRSMLSYLYFLSVHPV